MPLILGFICKEKDRMSGSFTNGGACKASFSESITPEYKPHILGEKTVTCVGTGGEEGLDGESHAVGAQALGQQKS